jgi:CelD/BcsL family acetyltransferase involved in cellulose biosynthesis
MVLGILDVSGRLMAICPWYIQRSAAHGWVLRWLGSGEVCSDYAGILCAAEDAEPVAEAVAAYLTGARSAECDCHPWDLLEVDGVDAEDPVVAQLLFELEKRGCSRHDKSAVRSWRLELPRSWDDFLGMVSQTHRRRLRRLDRDMFATGRAILRTVNSCEQFDSAMDLLIDLHQKRRQSVGDRGCFVLPRFTAFHREAARQMAAAGQSQLQLLELDGRTVAAQYQLISQGVTYVYQTGLDPQRLGDEPGHLINAAIVKQALERGGRAVDFLRGDERYKADFRAVARPLLATRVVPDRAIPRLRNRLWLAGRSGKRSLIRTSQRIVGLKSSLSSLALACRLAVTTPQEPPQTSEFH